MGFHGADDMMVESFDLSYDACRFIYEKLVEKGLMDKAVAEIHISAAENQDAELDIIIGDDCQFTSYGEELADLIGYQVQFNVWSNEWVFIPSR